MNLNEWQEKYGAISLVNNEEMARNLIFDFKDCICNRYTVLYGAGTVGHSMAQTLHKLDTRIDCVVDQKYREGLWFDKIEVQSPEILEGLSNSKQCVIFVAVNNKLLPEIYNMLNDMGVSKSIIYSAMEVNRLLKSSLCLCHLIDDIPLNLEECFECPIVDNECPILWKHAQKWSGYKETQEYRSENFRETGYILGQSCTLRCKHCNESLPYFSKKDFFVEREVVYKDLKKLASGCKFLGYVELVGGEPFLHPELGEIVEDILTINNIGIIHIFSNGTVIPDESTCKKLENKRVVVYISNYDNVLEGKLKENVENTVSKLKEYGVICKHGINQNWLDFASYDFVDDSEEELCRRFQNCFLSNCHRLYRGKLYGCPHHYGGTMLGHSADADEVVSIHKLDQTELADELENLQNKKYFEICKKCSMPYRAKSVKAAIQLSD